jgi:hypothetical protein
MVFGLMASAQAQVVNYTFTSGPGGDGFNWPASPTGQIDNDYFGTPQGIYIYNGIGNNLFYDDNYQTLGNGSHISGEAMWGNPLDNGSGGYLEIDLSTFNPGVVTDVSFDFAWSQAGVPAAPDSLVIYFQDSDGRTMIDSFQLSQTFFGLGGGTGYEDYLSFNINNLIDDGNVDGGNFIDIAYMEIYVDDIFNGGNSSEFAIDNFATNSAGGGLDPENSNVFPGELNGGLIGQSTKWLRTTSTSFVGFGPFAVSNDGFGGTTYSVALAPTTDPEWIVNSPATGETIYAGQQLNEGSGDVAYLDRNNPSGNYHADVVVSNDLNALDPDETVLWNLELYDAPALSDNTGATVQVHLGNSLFISNAAAGPHPGALRAGVEVSNFQTTGPFKFNTSSGDLVNGAFVGAGQTKTAFIQFNRYGLISGTHSGTASISLEMNSAPGSYLNGDPPLPDKVWNLSYNLTDVASDSAGFHGAESLGPNLLGVNNADTAATLLAGISSNNQVAAMVITADPGTNADLMGAPIDLTLASNLYVLQFTYLDGNLPVGILESQLQVLFYDTIAGEWDVAVDGNSGGTTTFFNGSYAAYLAAVGGGVLDAGDLGAFGVDTVNNHAWAILDHASIFGVGILTEGSLVGDLNGDGFVGIADLNIVLGNWNQTVPPADPAADPSGDNFVGIADLNEVLGNWNAGTPPAGEANIPEPASLVVLMVGTAALLKRE